MLPVNRGVKASELIFPRRKISVPKVEKYLQELHKKCLIFRYSVNGNDYLCMKNFEKHQPGLQKSKEAQSQIPTSTPELLWSNSRATPSQVKDKVKDKDKEQEKDSSSRSRSLSTVIKKYEQNIAPRSEAIESELAAAIEEYTAAWVIDAIKEAVMHNKLTWAYIQGILRNWKESAG